MYFNIEINILDWYSVEFEKVHGLVFINYWSEKCISYSLRLGNRIWALKEYK